MINTQTLARPYAKAAFEFARAAGKADAWSAMLNLAAVAVEVPEVEALLKDPRLTSESKVQSVVRLFWQRHRRSLPQFCPDHGRE